MQSSDIISEIEGIVKSQTEGVCSKWMIGRTNDVEESKIQHGEPDSWRYWDVDSVESAKEVEAYLVDKGMRQEAEGYDGADFVYIFYIGSPQENR